MTLLSKQIKEKYELGCVLYMMHLSNLDLIFEKGAIFSRNQLAIQGIEFTDISNSSVQVGRANITVPCSGLPLHSYVPLYWGRKTPMVAALHENNEMLVFLMFSTDLLAEYDCVITDGNARASETRFLSFTDIDSLELLTPKDINTVKYAHDDEVKRHKQSELLVLDKLTLKYLRYIVCYSDSVKCNIEKLLSTHRVSCKVYVGKGNYYYYI